MDIGTLAQWTGAAATFTASLVALFKEELVRRWRSPKLTAMIRLRAPDCNKTPIHTRTEQGFRTFECFYFRLWIENVGNQRAERVRVYASKLLKKHADGNFRDVEGFLPMNLR